MAEDDGSDIAFTNSINNDASPTDALTLTHIFGGADESATLPAISFRDDEYFELCKGKKI